MFIQWQRDIRFEELYLRNAWDKWIKEHQDIVKVFQLPTDIDEVLQCKKKEKP